MKMKRKLFAVLAAVLCLGSLAGCASQSSDESAMDPTMEAAVISSAQAIVQELAAYDEETLSSMIENYEYNDNSDMVASLQAWMSTQEEVGGLVQVNGATAVYEDRQYVAEVDATFERCPVDVTITYDRQGAITNLECSPQYSVADNMTRAAIHTVIGMGTVFIVLIFISFLISCFKYINAWEKRHNAGGQEAGEQAQGVPAPAAAPAAAVEETDPALIAGMMAVIAAEENLVNDLELVAVITAAISAYTDTPADGLVVRSIKRKPKSRWK